MDGVAVVAAGAAAAGVVLTVPPGADFFWYGFAGNCCGMGVAGGGGGMAVAVVAVAVAVTAVVVVVAAAAVSDIYSKAAYVGEIKKNDNSNICDASTA